MDDRQFEQMLAKLLQADFSAGTEEFRDELLVRCLAVLDADIASDVTELDDADFGLLAAAGDAAHVGGTAPYGRLSRQDAQDVAYRR